MHTTSKLLAMIGFLSMAFGQQAKPNGQMRVSIDSGKLYVMNLHDTKTVAAFHFELDCGGVVKTHQNIGPGKIKAYYWNRTCQAGLVPADVLYTDGSQEDVNPSDPWGIDRHVKLQDDIHNGLPVRASSGGPSEAGDSIFFARLFAKLHKAATGQMVAIDVYDSKAHPQVSGGKIIESTINSQGYEDGALVYAGTGPAINCNVGFYSEGLGGVTDVASCAAAAQCSQPYAIVQGKAKSRVNVQAAAFSACPDVGLYAEADYEFGTWPYSWPTPDITASSSANYPSGVQLVYFEVDACNQTFYSSPQEVNMCDTGVNN